MVPRGLRVPTARASQDAGVAEPADAQDLKSWGSQASVRVRLPLPAFKINNLRARIQGHLGTKGADYNRFITIFKLFDGPHDVRGAITGSRVRPELSAGPGLGGQALISGHAQIAADLVFLDIEYHQLVAQPALAYQELYRLQDGAALSIYLSVIPTAASRLSRSRASSCSLDLSCRSSETILLLASSSCRCADARPK